MRYAMGRAVRGSTAHVANQGAAPPFSFLVGFVSYSSSTSLRQRAVARTARFCSCLVTSIRVLAVRFMVASALFLTTRLDAQILVNRTEKRQCKSFKLKK